MNELELIKQAYAYGAAIALQEAGIEKNAADELATKLAENGLTDLQDGATGGLKGLLAGGAGGAGLGALLGLLKRRRQPFSVLGPGAGALAVRKPLSAVGPGLGALLGGGAGALSGGAIGESVG